MIYVRTSHIIIIISSFLDRVSLRDFSHLRTHSAIYPSRRRRVLIIFIRTGNATRELASDLNLSGEIGKLVCSYVAYYNMSARVLIFFHAVACSYLEWQNVIIIFISSINDFFIRHTLRARVMDHAEDRSRFIS